MKFKFKEAFILNENETEETEIYYDEDAKAFYWYTDKGYEEVPVSMRSTLYKEKAKQDKLEKLKKANPDFDEEEYDKNKQKNIEKIKARFQGSNDSGKLDSIRKETDKVKKQQNMLRAKTAKKTSKYAGISLVNPSVSEIVEDIIQDLEINILDNDEIPWDFEATYNHPNSMNIDPSIMMQDNTYELQTEVEDEDKPKPYVYFFFDRSNSFNGGAQYSDGTWSRPEAAKKAQLGRDIEAELINAMNDGRLLFKTYFFASSVHEDEAKALAEGGNNGERLVQTVKNITEGHPSNVIIVTDSDNSGASSKIKIDGGVWLVFCSQYDETLKNKIVGTKVNKEYWFD